MLSRCLDTSYTAVERSSKNWSTVEGEKSKGAKGEAKELFTTVMELDKFMASITPLAILDAARQERQA